MKTLANKSQNKAHLYGRRKHRVNTIMKANMLDTPRLIVNRSNKHIYAQIVAHDGNVLAAVDDRKLTSGTKKERAFEVGKSIAKQGKKSGVETVVFDRNGYLYHGRVAELAAGAREGGLEF